MVMCIVVPLVTVAVCVPPIASGFISVVYVMSSPCPSVSVKLISVRSMSMSVVWFVGCSFVIVGSSICVSCVPIS